MRFVAGRGAAAKSRREDAAGRGAAAELTSQGAFAGCLLAEALWRRAIGKTMLAGAPMRRAIGNKLLARMRAASGRILSDQWCAIIASLLYLCRQEASGRRACSAWKNCRAQKCLQCMKKLQRAEVPAEPGNTRVRRRACRAWKAAEVQKAFGRELWRICFACNK